VTVVRIDLAKRQMDLRVVVAQADEQQAAEKPREPHRRKKRS
jgi:hypothetical protein